MVSISSEKITLSNGLDVILHEDHAIPLVAVNVWYHVGSKDEEQGRTGFAHLFEHIMFEGSKHHNSSHFDPLQKAGVPPPLTVPIIGKTYPLTIWNWPYGWSPTAWAFSWTRWTNSGLTSNGTL
ncbi:MAG TPA: insulinase family protein [Dehalococcoidia bacterium]|nr:insulinase family protein [Dehalococcoidia bacterium]